MSVQKLTETERAEIEALIRDPKHGSSDRVRDRARTRLKKMGLIRFDRPTWAWVVSGTARAALQGEER